MHRWDEARRLEQQDRLAEAIDTLRTQPAPGAAYWEAQVSNLFEQRARRLWRSGQDGAAFEAAQLAVSWRRTYAAGASGSGEGAMLLDDVRRLERRLQRILTGRPSLWDRVVRVGVWLMPRRAGTARNQ